MIILFFVLLWWAIFYFAHQKLFPATVTLMAGKDMKTCPHCRGEGKVPGMKGGSKVTCPVCRGAKTIPADK